MTVADTTAASSGDSYLIRPTRQGASDIGVLITNERDIAAADPLITANAAGNGGTGSISSGGLVAIGPGASVPTAPAITLEYQAGNQLAITAGPAGPPPTRFVQADGTVVGTNEPFVAGQTYYVEVPTLGTFAFEMSGTPQAGDTFTLSDNTGGVGDNRNARRMADLQNANVMIGGTATFANTYGTLVADVGTKTNQAATNATVQKNLLSQAEATQAEISGVNLDEEAADLVRFQQAYQAAAQVINVANTLFDSLLGAVRR
jgi:flagellar hook-associated protein 1 FlgK